MHLAEIAIACERDPDEPDDLEEIEAALRLLLEDGLAEREPDPPRKRDSTVEPDAGPASDTHLQTLYRPTHAAVRANELSF
ncbi:hypothetical protein [Caballeronia sp.]|uniref:hypothetical protein n=1 Tax=Caballeronia sp. TaxID=1931223 RepID=UPI003C53347C